MVRGWFKRFKPVELAFKQLLFNCCRPLLTRPEAFTTLDGNKMKRILVLRPEKLGDTLVTLPLVDALREAYPHIEFSLLTSPRSLSLVKSDPRFTKLFVYRKRPFCDLLEIRKMRREKFDCVIDMICGDSVTTLMLASLCSKGAPRLGQQKHEFARYYDYSVYQPVNDRMEHIIDIGLSLVQAFGLKRQYKQGYGQPYLSERSLAMADRLLRPLRSLSGYLFGYNLSAGSASRIWAEENSIALVERILRAVPDSQVLLIATPSDRERAVRIESAIRKRIQTVPEELSFGEACAIVRELDLLISPDTSLVHVARSFAVPVLGLYPGDYKNTLMWYPYEMKEAAVTSRERGNIFDLTVDEIYTRFSELFASHVTARA